MSIFSTPEPEDPSDEHLAGMRSPPSSHPGQWLYRHLWLNLLFAVLLASHLCSSIGSDDLDME